jgi:hypothetical protein
MGKFFQKYFYREPNIYIVGILYCAVASAFIWWIGFARPAYLFWLYNIPRLDILYLNSGGVKALLRIIISFIVLGGSYWFAYQWASKVRGKAAWAVIIGGAILQAGVLLLMAPFNSTDIFDNISHGRILGFYHTNPFMWVTADFPTDPFTRFTGWPEAPSAYGPLWEQAAALTARLAGNGIPQNIIAFKLLPGLFWAGCVALVALIFRKRKPGSALRGALFLAWNPVALFEIFGNGHNDPSFLLWILLAVWAMLERRYTIAILSLVVGTLFKFMPAVLIPAAGLIALQELPGWKQRAAFLFRSALISVVLIVAAYAPFWEGIKTLSIDRRAHLFATTLGSSIYQTLLPALGKEQSAALVSPLAAVLTLGFAVWMGFHILRSRAPDRFALSAMIIFAFYLMVTVLFFWPWYTIWLIALVPLVRDKQLRTLAIVFSFVAINKDLLNFLNINSSQTVLPEPWMEIWLTLRVMLVPWLYAVYSLLSHRRGTSLMPEVTLYRAKPGED